VVFEFPFVLCAAFFAFGFAGETLLPNGGRDENDFETECLASPDLKAEVSAEIEHC